MRWWGLVLACAAQSAQLATAQEPAPQARSDACLKLDNRVLGPRTSNRPLPLLSGDAAHGFHPACMVTWQTLSPRNEPLPITDCFSGSLLQIANEGACGSGTGPLWVNSRWVMTSAELSKPAARAATCQQLDTGAWAGTRAYDFDCVPQRKALKNEGAPAESPARPAAAAAPAPAAAPTSPAATSPAPTSAAAAPSSATGNSGGPQR
jgi:hypothetical protein